MNKLASKIFALNSFSKGDVRSVIVKKNIVGSLIIKGISILVSMILVPATLGYVSSELYGIWLTLSSIMIWLNFFDVGFTLGLKNRLAEAISMNDFKKGRSLISTTYFMMLLIFTPICIVLEFIIPFIDWASFLNVSQVYNPDIIKALHIMIACVCLQMVLNVLVTIVAAYQKVALSSIFPVIGNILSLLIIYILTCFCPPSLFVLAFAISVMPVFVLIISSCILFSIYFNRVAPKIKSINKKYTKDIFSLGIKFFIIQIQVVVLYQSTNILISNISGAEDVTIYNIAYKYLGVAMMAFTIILNPLWPAFTDAYVKKDFIWMNNIYQKMIKILLTCMIIMVLMVLFAQYFYSFWIGDKVIVPLNMTILVAVYMMIQCWCSLQVYMINGIGVIKLQTFLVLIGMCLHIPLSLILGKYIGAVGVISSMIIINLIYVSVFSIQIRKILKQKASGIWAQ